MRVVTVDNVSISGAGPNFRGATLAVAMETRVRGHWQ